MKFLHKKHQIKKKGIKKMNSNEDILNLVLIGAKNSGKTYFLSQLPNSLVSANDSTTRYLKKIKENIDQTGQTQARLRSRSRQRDGRNGLFQGDADLLFALAVVLSEQSAQVGFPAALAEHQQR